MDNLKHIRIDSTPPVKSLLEICVNRLESSEKCKENTKALVKIKRAIYWLDQVENKND